MAQIQDIKSEGLVCTIVLSFNLARPDDIALMARVLDCLGPKQPIKGPVVARTTRKVQTGKVLPAVKVGFHTAVANRLNLPNLADRPEFQALVNAYYIDTSLTIPISQGGSPGQKSTVTAQKIEEMAMSTSNPTNLSQVLAAHADGSQDEFKELAEILFGHFKPESEPVVVKSSNSNEDEVTRQARELALDVARTLYINSQLAESPALTQFCEAFIYRGITQPSKIRAAWDSMARKATEGTDGILQVLVENLGLSAEDENTLILTKALQNRREFSNLSYVLAGQLDQELTEGGVDFDEAHFKGVSAYYALMGKLWRESKIRTLKEAQAAISNILDRATSREQFEDILADEYGLMRSGQQGTSLRGLAYTLRTLKTVRLVTSATQKEE